MLRDISKLGLDLAKGYIAPDEGLSLTKDYMASYVDPQFGKTCEFSLMEQAFIFKTPDVTFNL